MKQRPPSFGVDTSRCEFCCATYEPARYDPVLGAYACQKCLAEMDQPEPDEEA